MLIQWPRAKYWDKAWNPVVGCHPCSPACDNCYARAWARRFGQGFEPHASSHVNPPLKGGVVFCGNVTDMFGTWRRIGAVYFDVLSTIFSNNQVKTWLWLTKRVGRMAVTLERLRENHRTMLGNHYFGFTAENQEWYDRRFVDYVKIPAIFNGWLSAEPLLGPIDLGLDDECSHESSLYQWVVVGCESGPARRPCKLEWVESIVEQCRAADVPVFVKQLDIDGKCVTDIDRFPAHLRIRQVPWAVEG